MSGGSWNYLFQQDRPRSAGEMRDAAKRLAELGDPLAAAGAERCATLLDAAQAEFERLRDALHGMEWVDSGDWGDDTFTEIKAGWQAKLSPSERGKFLLRLRQLASEIQDAAIAVAGEAASSTKEP